ncbi:BnaA07g24250D [Brassica napus]|uniref:BnaA07g24250D protein n=1 Tax=Brassica napus TaxID=3708 RepID=A0A078F1R4_BRANA|nr:BnaA07g24250D [Brassica napus]
MHNLLVQLGRDIVCKKEPGKRQFLVDAREICQVLTNETVSFHISPCRVLSCSLQTKFILCLLFHLLSFQGSESLVGMDLDLSEINRELISNKTFKKMCNLQFLRFYGRSDDNGDGKLHSPQNLKYLSPKLRLLHWDYYPSTCLPSGFITVFLGELNMRNSKLNKLWEGVQVSDYVSLFSLLKYIQFVLFMLGCMLSEYILVNIFTTKPHIIPNLKIFLAGNCSSLMELPDSIGNATSLKTLDLSGCSSLKTLPSSVGKVENLIILALKRAIGASRDHVRADNLKGHIPSGSSSTSLCSCGRKHFLEAASSTYPILPIHSPNAARSKDVSGTFQFMQGVSRVLNISNCTLIQLPIVGEAIPLDDNSVDAVISTLVLCSVPDVKQTLQEIKRVLKPGGIFLFIEHVAAEDGTFFRHVQNVLDPLQQVVADGCHLTRNTGLYIAGAGFSGGAEINTAAMYSFPWIIRPHVYGVAYK